MISTATGADRPRLFDLWESSVRATHHFLSEDDIRALAPLVREELARQGPIYCVRDAAGIACAFMIVEGDAIEGLFVAPEHRGKGAGRALVEHACNSLGARRVDVNEQNPQAVGFYRRMGFRAVSRSPLDAQGRAFPILRLVLATPG